MDCPFCIIDHERTRIVATSTYSVVILSNPRLMPGHLVAFPKRHVERLAELDHEERVDLFNIVIQFQEKILHAGSPGCDIVERYAPYIPHGRIKMNHVHIQLRPRMFNDALFSQSQRFQEGLWQDLNKDEEVEFLKRYAQ